MHPNISVNTTVIFQITSNPRYKIEIGDEYIKLKMHLLHDSKSQYIFVVIDTIQHNRLLRHKEEVTGNRPT